MPWFQKLCRHSGRLVHDIIHAGSPPHHYRRVVNKDVQQRQVNDQMTLRRTTIDEVEVKRTEDNTGNNAETPSQ